ncbi:hypothetical protein [Cryobacterium melibiosiphilum]|uniref:hypothetical protein n=1 Tax=Cryobacterium melibiosiphilum TaxID=995039 RepID=UPI0011C22C68|nr:hypothetical protein [Cryobacterium melibiosiphilum]
MQFESNVLATLLRQSVMKRSQRIVLSLNRHGQLPTVLINPRNVAGRLAPGIWLGEPNDFVADGTTYRWMSAADYSVHFGWADSASDESANPGA